MKGRTFAAALWAESWEKILESKSECEQGVASFDAYRGVRLDIPFGEILQNQGDITIEGDELPGSLDWLYGFTQDGCRLALGGVISLGTGGSYPGAPHQTLAATRLLYSREGRFDPNEAVARATLEIDGLAEWLGKSPIRTCERRDGRRTLSSAVDIDFEDRPCNADLLDDDDYAIRVYHRVTTRETRGMGLEIGHACKLEIRFKRLLGLADAERVAFRAAEFFSFCLGFHAEVGEMTLTFESGTTAGYLAPLVGGQAPDRILTQCIPLPFREIQDEVCGMLGTWLAEGDLRTPSSLLTSLATKEWRLPVDVKFNTAAQMLEALSKAGADLRSMGEEDFEAFREAVMSALDGIEDKEMAKKAKETCAPRNGKGQSRLLNELIEKHRNAAGFVFGDPMAFAKRHAGLRNGVTHRDDAVTKKMDKEDLYWHTDGVLAFAYCVVGELLGLPADVMTRRLQASAFKRQAIRKVKAMYSPRPNPADGTA